MDLYGDIPSPDASEDANMAPIPLHLPQRPEAVPETATEKARSPERTQGNETPTTPVEVKPLVMSSTTSLRFVPPSLRNKAIHRTPPPKAQPRTVAPATVPAMIPRGAVLASTSETNGQENQCKMLLDDIVDEYDPMQPNEFSRFLQVQEEKRQEEAARELEDQRMLDVLKALAEGGEEPPLEQEKNGKKEDFGTRLMRKYGWKVGQGLGKDAQGISVPLMAKKTGERSGMIVNVDQSFQKHSPSTVILLENMTDEIDRELEDETREECTNFGRVLNVVGAKGFDNRVRIFVEFETYKEARQALGTMNGRYFGGRQITARYYPHDVFKRREYTR